MATRWPGVWRNSAFDLKIRCGCRRRCRELIVEDGAVRGATVERDGRLVRVNAKRGVILACGGFPHDVARRKKCFPHAPTGNEHFSPGPAATPGRWIADWRNAAAGHVEE